MIICTGIINCMDTPKRPRGRPPVENPETERFEFRLSLDRLERYQKAADVAGKALAAWVKATLDRASRRRQ